MGSCGQGRSESTKSALTFNGFYCVVAPQGLAFRGSASAARRRATTSRRALFSRRLGGQRVLWQDGPPDEPAHPGAAFPDGAVRAPHAMRPPGRDAQWSGGLAWQAAVVCCSNAKRDVWQHTWNPCCGSSVIGFAFVGRSEALRRDGESWFVDQLFDHLRLRRFVSIDPKAGRLPPEHGGKTNCYQNLMDDSRNRPYSPRFRPPRTAAPRGWPKRYAARRPG